MNTRRLTRWAGAALAACYLVSAGPVMAQPGPVARADPQAVLVTQPSTCLPPCLVTQPSTSPPTNADATAFPTFSSQAADDFVVPNGVFWHITNVMAVGQDVAGGGSGVSSVLVQFYSDAGGGLPAATAFYGVSYPGSSYTDTIVVALSPVVILGPGHYWFSVQPKVTCTGGNCQGWNWNESPGQTNAESAWRNPDGFLNSNCTSWQHRVTTCARPLTSTGKDLAFELDGTTTPVVGKVFLPTARR